MSKLYEITKTIVAAVLASAQSSTMPWNRVAGLGTPVNAVSGRAYRGINVLLLLLAGRQRGYATGEWATYRQWAARGSQVREGERSTTVVLWKPRESCAPDGDPGPESASSGLIARAFRVFNTAQVEGPARSRKPLPESTRVTRAEAFFAAQPARIWHGSDAAFYDPHGDSVSIPSFGAFVSSAAYYSVFAHELTHWTGAKSQLNRDLTGRFGSEAYAMEELVAELGAAFVLGHLELSTAPRPDHAGYIASWLKVLRDDPRAIFAAAAGMRVGWERPFSKKSYNFNVSWRCCPSDANSSPQDAVHLTSMAA